MKVGLGAAREELMNERQDDIILSLSATQTFQGPDVGVQTP